MKKSRNANVELLRVISMLMIVAYHYSIYGFFADELSLSGNKLFVDLFGMWGKVGTDAFVLISGYYMVSSPFRLKKLLSLMGSVWFYSIGFTLVFAVLDIMPLSLGMWKSVLFPLLSSHYWFISYYAVLMLLSPFLNRLARALEREAFAALLLLLFLLVTVLPTLLHIRFADGSLPLFVLLYLSGACCRLHARPGRGAGRRAALFLLLCAALVVGADLYYRRAGDFLRLQNASGVLMGAYSPLSYLAALLLLLYFCGLEPRENRFITALGGLTVGVYLFHQNLLFSAIIWQNPFRTSSLTDSPLLPLHAFGVTAALFTAGCLVELLRQRTLGRVWDRLTDAALPALERLLARCGAGLLRLWDRLLG